MKVDLTPDFLARPFAHRAYHDVAQGRPENSIAAIEAAIAHGFGIEIDVQPSADAEAMVFHDYDLGRLTDADGAIAKLSRADLASVELNGGGHVPTLDEALAVVAGQVPMLIEVKDQDGALGPSVGALEQAVAKALLHYEGPVAVMSFNPHSVSAMKEALPDVPRGLVTTHFPPDEWAAPETRLAELRAIPDYESLEATFISHDARDLESPQVARLRDSGATILCWTIKSSEQETFARQFADNVTFEGYNPLGAS